MLVPTDIDKPHRKNMQLHLMLHFHFFTLIFSIISCVYVHGRALINSQTESDYLSLLFRT